MTTTAPTGTALVHAAGLLANHLASHPLPEPVSLGIVIRGGRSTLNVQLRARTVANLAAELVIWADTLSTLTIEAWHIPAREGAQLSIASTLSGPAGGVELEVYGGCAHDPILITGLSPGCTRTVSLGELRAWAASTPTRAGGGDAA